MLTPATLNILLKPGWFIKHWFINYKNIQLKSKNIFGTVKISKQNCTAIIIFVFVTLLKINK